MILVEKNNPTPSFEGIVQDLIRPLSAYLGKMVGSPSEGDDLLQETLIRIARALPKFEGRSSVKTWAFRIANHVAIDHIRKTKKAQFVEFDERDDPAEPDEDDKLVIGEMNDCIRGVINSLPPEYRSVIVLYNLERHSVDEISEITGTSVNNVKIRIHRGKKRLAEALNRKCHFYKSPEGTLRCDRK